MLITSKTTSPSVTNSDELIIPIPLIIPGIKTHGHDYSMNIWEPRILSPRYSKTGVVTDGGGGIGLGIVAALDKFGGGKKTVTKFTGGANNSWNANRPSDPIAIGVSTNTKTKGNEGLGSVEMSTSTTAGAGAGAGAASVGSMYCNGGNNIEDERNQVGVFYESPSPIFYKSSAVIRDYPPSDFLSSCHLCKKKLHGKDIYMYRGEKAFCSPECRYQQIAADERKDKKRPRRRNGVSRSSFDVSSSAGASAYLDDHRFSPGIMAT